MDVYKALSAYNVILASQSPRRHQLLKGLGIDFSTEPVNIDETFPSHLQAGEIALYLAELKAKAFRFQKHHNKPLLISADTIVWINNHILGKPENFEDGVKILSELSGCMHQVFTGVCLRTVDKMHSFIACSDVYFKDLSQDEIRWYMEKYKPYDKAGAYGAQEWIGYVAIRRIEGSYFNVMGLPTQLLWEELRKFIS